MHMLQRKFRKQINELVEASVRLAELGFATSRGGNLSSRPEPDVVLITPTGFSKKEIRPQDILIMRLDGTVLFSRPGVNPSSETPAHLRIMRMRPDVRGIIHAHPPILTGFALSGNEILSKPIHPELIIEIGPLISLDYSEPTSEALAKQFEKVINLGNAFLMKSHGVLICNPIGIGRTLELLEMLEMMAFSAWVGMATGKVAVIPGKEIDKLEAIMRTRNLPMPGPAGATKRLRQLYSQVSGSRKAGGRG